MKKLITKYNSVLFPFILCLIVAINASAQTWSLAASMADSRYIHTATLLSNGKVLVTGGEYSGGDLASCELYNPVANTWSSAASMAGSRAQHTATLLSNGKVLVTGGLSGSTILTSCELYDPVTNTWSAAASMEAGRYHHTATLLSNGKVLVTGGYDSGPISSCELYDPVTNTWSTAASVTDSRFAHTSTLFSDGTVLVTGGLGAGGFLTTCELYNPLTNTWSATASMAVSRFYHTATLFLNGKVYVTGGSSGNVLTSCELYDPVSNTWSASASMTGGRYDHTTTLLSNGKVLVVGGYGLGGSLTTCELYDPLTNTWSAADSMTGGRYDYTATLLTNGKVLVTGGNNGSSTLSSCELYSPCSAPIFSSCPSNITANATTGTCVATASYVVTATGTPDPTLAYSFSGATTGSGNGTGSGSTFNKGVTNISITASNGCGSDVSCNFTVTVNDNQPPVITASGTPSNGTLGCNPSPATINAALGTATATDNCGAVTPTFTDATVVITGCQRSQTRTWNVTDSGGNAATPVSRTAIWTVDLVAPLITATGTPTNGTLGCNPSSATINAALGTATATDNCGVVFPIFTDATVVITGCQRSQTRTWNVTDACGNAATPVSRTATWTVDFVPPLITTTGTPTNGTLSCNPSAATINAALGTATAFDNCGAVFPIFIDAAVVITGCQRSQTRFWNVTDACGNAAATVSRTATWKVDTTAPIITATGTPTNGTLGCNPSAAIIDAALGTATATDNCGAATPIFTDATVVITGCLRSQTRTWNVTDACGNTAVPVSRTATWTVDLVAPLITSTGTPTNGTLGYNPSAATIDAALGTATATDNCGAVTPTFTDAAVVITGCLRSQTRTWNVTDACGSAAAPVSRTTTWTVDATAPVIICPATSNLDRVADAGGNTYTAAGTEFNATATDNCAETSLTYTLTGVTTGTGTTLAGVVFESGVTTITWTATDDSTTSVDCSFKVTVLESENPDLHWVKIAAGGDSSYGIKSDGTLWAWGYNEDGQLGTDTNWKSISTGSLHAVALKSDGTLWAWGQNGGGQLGDGTTIDKSIPTLISTETNWQSIATGVYHTVAIKTNGTLWTWGYNGYGQLGNGTNTDINTPTQIGTDMNWKSIAGGAFYTVAIKTDGTLWAWGDNSYGQIGDGTNFRRNIPVQIGTETNWKTISAGAYHTIAIKSDGTLWTWGQNVNGRLGDGTFIDRNSPAQIGTDVNWQIVGAGGNHSIAKKTDGTLWAWGFNGEGQLGDGTNTERNTPILVGTETNWQSIAAGGRHTIGLKSGGMEFCATGNNNYGQLGDGTSSNRNTFLCTPVPEPYTITCPVDKTVNIDFGNNTAIIDNIDPILIPNNAAYTYTLSGDTVATGSGTASGLTFNIGTTTVIYTLTADATKSCSFAVTVLENENPQLHWTNIAAGGNSSFGIKSDGTLWTWGFYINGQLGTDTNWKTISSGGTHAVALKTDGTLWAWGQNGGGQLGDGTTAEKSNPTPISIETNWQSLGVGAYHTLAIKTDGTLWAWGYNGYGQLGNGTSTDINIPTQIGTEANWKSIAGGAFYTVAIKTDGTLWAWGDNSYGQIGDGTNFRRNIPIQIGTETNWKSISAGAYHTIAIKSDGTLWTWGQNVNGRLGDGTFTDRNSPAQIGTDTNWQLAGAGGNHSTAKKTNGTLWAWGYNGEGQIGDGTNTERNTPVLVGTETNWQSIAAGGNHTIGLKFGGMELCATGSNISGQLGDGTTINRNTFLCIPVTEPYAITCPVDKTVNIDFGNNTAIIDDIDPVLTPNNAAYTYTLSGDTVAASSGTASGLTFNKGVTTVTYTLTADVTKTCSFTVTVLENENPQIHWKSIAVGSYHTVGIKSDGTFWAWGRNLEGQLGNGTYLNSNIPIQIGTDTTWQSVSVGYDHTIAVKSNGTLWAWGNNFYGQLGDGTTIYRNVPVQIGTSTNWVNISLGNFASFGIKSDGTLWTWGYNIGGQLGDGTFTNRTVPEQIGNDTNWRIITSGNYNTYGIKSDGTLWGWGLNTSGQLGDGTFVTRNIPLQIGIAANWKSITAGDGHTVGIKSDGTLWAWGLNGYGQLGDGTNTNRIVPEQIGTDSDWQVIAARSVLTMGIKLDNTLWVWGDNSGGQLGDGTFDNKNVPTKIGVETNWTKIANGESHSIGLKLDGLGFCGTGSNNFGQLGDGTFIDKNSFICIPITEPYTISCTTDKIINTDAGFCTALVSAIDPVITPADTTYSYSLSGVTSGSGSGSASGLTFNKGETTVTYTLTADVTKTCSFKVTVNGEAAGALSFDGVNDYVSIPALNLNSNTVTIEAWIKPKGLQGDFDAIVFSRSGNTIAGFGMRANNEIEYHWNNDGLTYAWSSGAIAPPDEWSHVALVIEPAKATIYLNGVAHVNNVNHAIEEFNGITRIGKDDPYLSQDRQFKGDIEEVRIWNRPLCEAEIENNMTGELSLPQEGLIAYYKFNQGLSACSNTGLNSLLDSSGNNFNGTLNNFTLTGNASNWTTGNVSGTSPDFEHTPPVIACPTPISVSIDLPNTTAIVHFIATATDDSGIASITYSKDPNTEFPLGITEVIVTATDNNCNSSTCSFTVTVLENENPQVQWLSIDAGRNHTAGIKIDGSLWAWGQNTNGELGDGTNISKNNPVQIATDTNWKSISTGADHTLGIKTDGTLWAWGLNTSGQLGNGTVINRNSPVQIGVDNNWAMIQGGYGYSMGLRLDGTLWAWGNNGGGKLGDGTVTNRNFPVQIGTDNNWINIAAGGLNSLGLKSNGTLWAWGNNSNGLLGDGTTIQRNSPVQIGTDNTWVSISTGFHKLGLKSNGTIWAWGSNIAGQLGDGTNIDRTSPVQIGSENNWISIEAGAYHSVGSKSDGTLWAWGQNANGELGDGTNTFSNNSPMQIGDNINWQSITAGANHTIILKSDGLQFCATGYNFYGQLGDGTNISKNTFVCIPDACILPIANAGSSSAICSGSSIIIGATAVTGNTYSWVSSPVGFTSTAAKPTVNPTVTTTYTLTETVTATGCAKSNSVTITVNPLPIVTLSGLPSLCLGSGSLVLGGGSPLGGIYYGTGVSSGSFNPTVAGTGIHVITYTYTDGNGCSNSAFSSITVNPMPAANAGTPSTICSGVSAALGATAIVGNTYSWVSNPVGFTSAVSNPLVSPTVTTTYILIETVTATGCAKSNSVTITVNPVPIVSLGTFSPLCINSPPFALSGGLPLGGIYSGNGVSSGSFNPSVAGLGNHVVTYTYTDNNGCSNFATSTIQVNGPTANAGLDTTVYINYAQNKCTTLSGSASGGLPPYKYLWSTGAKTTSINVCPTVTTTYTIRVTDAAGCFQTDDVIVNAVDITCAKNSVYVCHNNSTTCVKINDVKAHLAHGDYLGACSNTISFAKSINTTVKENNDTFLLYPNPTTGLFTVEVCKNNVIEEVKLQIVNVLGQIIYSKKAFKIEGCIKEKIELSHALPEGIYSLNLIIGENVETKKLILTK